MAFQLICQTKQQMLGLALFITSKQVLSRRLYRGQKRKKKNAYLLTIISSPSPVARQSDPATLVAIFSRGRVIIGKPAHKISVPVVCALHKGLKRY